MAESVEPIEPVESNSYLETSLLTTLVYGPLYRIKTILQTQDMIPAIKSSARPIKGAIHCIKRIYKEEGARSFWRGSIPLFFTILYDEIFQIAQNETLDEIELEVEQKKVPRDQAFSNIDTNETKTIEFASESKNNEEEVEVLTVKKINETHEDNVLTYPGTGLSVFLVLWRILIHPVEVLRVRMSSDFGTKVSRQYTGLFHALKSLYKAEGIKAMYRGYLPLTLYVILEKNSLVYMERREPDRSLNVLNLIFAEAVIYPLSVVSSRMMMITGNPFVKYQGLMHCVKATYNEFGIRGFYKGFQISLFFYAVMVALNIRIVNASEEE